MIALWIFLGWFIVGVLVSNINEWAHITERKTVQDGVFIIVLWPLVALVALIKLFVYTFGNRR